MTAKKQNFDIWQGEAKRLKFAVVDENDNPKTLTGATAVWKAYTSLRDATVDISKTGTVISIDGTNDGVQVDIDPADTEDLTPGDYYHECRVTLGSIPEVVAIGAMKLWQSKTL